jgi:hypothetical protein
MEGTLDDIQPQEFSTQKGNTLAVAISLATGQARILGSAEMAREAAEATRRAANKGSEVRVFSSSASS